MALPILYASGSNPNAWISRQLLAGDLALGSGTVVSGTVSAGAISSGNIASGQISAAHISSGTIIAGAGISVTANAANITITNLSGGFTLTSGIITSGMLGDFAVNVNNINSGAVTITKLVSGLQISGLILSGGFGSGQISAAHISSGTIIAGAGISVTANANNITIANLSGGFTLTSGIITSGMLGDFVVNTNNINSGAVTITKLVSGLQISGLILSGGLGSGQVGDVHLANFTINGRSVNSGALDITKVVSGFQGSGLILSGRVGSGQITWTHLASGLPCVVLSGTQPPSPIIGELWYDFGATAQVFNVTSGMLGDYSVNANNLNSGAVTWSALASGVVYSGGGLCFENYLANGGMWFCQRYIPTTNTPISSGNAPLSGDIYSADRWKTACWSGGSLLYQRWDQFTSGFASGADARYYGAWMVGKSGGKIAIYQPIENLTTADLNNKTITFQIKAKSPTSGTIFCMGILQTISGTTVDTIPNSLVSGFAVGTSGTDPTWAATVAALSLTSVVQLQSVWNIYTVSVQTQSGSVNLIPAIWANNPMASGTTIHMTECGLYQD